MVFDRLYQHIFDKVLEKAQDYLESKEGEKYINEVIDSFVDRQISRFQGSAGGVIKAQNAEMGNQTLIGQLIQAFLPRLLNSSSPNKLTERNPFG